MDGKVWTDTAMAAARHSASRYIDRGTVYISVATLLALLALCILGWKAFPNITLRHVDCVICSLVMFALVVELAPDVILILLHTGLKFRGREIVPRILPNVCELARVVERKDQVWPCARDEVVGSWKMGVMEISRDNMIVAMCWRMLFTIGLNLGNAWLHRWMGGGTDVVLNEAEHKEGKDCDVDCDRDVAGVKGGGEDSVLV